MLLLMGQDPGLMIPDDVDLGDYEALWQLAERLGEVRSRGMKEEEINKLPTRRFRRKAGSKDEESCSICMSEYKMAEDVQMLPCKHEYHKDCLLEWLKVRHCVLIMLPFKEEGVYCFANVGPSVGRSVVHRQTLSNQ